MRRSPQCLLRFCLVGAAVLGFDYAMLWVFHHGMPKLVAVSLAYGLAVTLHFFLNKWWVFKAGPTPMAGQITRYVLTATLCLACTTLVVSFALKVAGGNVFIAKTIAIPPTTLLGFVLMRWFVFQAATQPRS
jgi:putative flippase GtrA